jgi:hypothetical protein
MSTTDSFLAVVEAYGRATKLAEATISTRVLRDGKRIKAIRAGKDIGARRLEEAMLWLSENWPAGAEWPTGITRPVGAEAQP